MRIFISSTFRDMQAERDELAKFVFPQVRRLCEHRGATWGYVDLRWGITDEQKAEGKVLPICLDSIQRCRPYFIGLLGERYGWIPDEIPSELIQGQPWLAEHRDHSVTELEIVHGVLNNPAMAEHAFFYFRDPSFAAQLADEQRADFLESASPDEIQRLGPEEAGRRALERERKLAALKDRIRRSGFPLRENYRDPRQLGEWVLRDLTALVDRLWPEGTQPSPLEREATDHEAFAASRLGAYVRRQDDFDALDTHVQGEAPPLTVLGDSGSGKSALLANWAEHYRGAHPGDAFFMHFIGASPASSDWAAMLRRIMGWLHSRLGLHEQLPDQPGALRAAFANLLAMAAAKARLVLILDGLDQLGDHDQAPDLIWLPPVIPGNARLILSTLPGRPLDALTSRGWPTLQVEPLHPAEREQLITRYLAESGKALSPSLTGRIAQTPQASNPLFLRAALDELMISSTHELLEERIDSYLEANTPAALFERILSRYEQDYERDRPGLVREAMSLLWAARRGLSEVELLDLLGTEGKQLPHAHWAPLHLAAGSSLVNRAGLLGFFHSHLRQAAEHRYLQGAEERRAVHLRLADYFKLGDLGSRQVEELPWQLAEAGAWDRLYAVLCDLPFFQAMNRTNAFEVKRSWALVEANSGLRMVDGYRPVIEAPELHQEHAWDVALLLAETGHLQEALSLRDYLIEHFHEAGNWGLLAASIGSQANVLYMRGELDRAAAMHREEEHLCRELGLDGGLALALVNHAPIAFDSGDLEVAQAMYQEAEELFGRAALAEQESLRLTYTRGRAKALTGRANILRARGEMQAALALHKESERLCREIGHKDELAVSLTNQGHTLFELGELEAARALYAESEGLSRETGNREWLANSISNQANVLYRRGAREQAMALYQQAERLFREIGNRAGLKTSLHNQAQIHTDGNDAGGAIACHEETERLCREMRDGAGLVRALNDHAFLLYSGGQLAQALTLLEECEAAGREFGHPRDLAKALILRAVIVGLQMGRPGDALPAADEAHRLAVECGDGALANQVESLRRQIRSLAGGSK